MENVQLASVSDSEAGVVDMIDLSQGREQNDEGDILESNMERIMQCKYFEHFLKDADKKRGERSHTWHLMKKLNPKGVVDGVEIGERCFENPKPQKKRYNFLLHR